MTWRKSGTITNLKNALDILVTLFARCLCRECKDTMWLARVPGTSCTHPSLFTPSSDHFSIHFLHSASLFRSPSLSFQHHSQLLLSKHRVIRLYSVAVRLITVTYWKWLFKKRENTQLQHFCSWLWGHNQLLTPVRMRLGHRLLITNQGVYKCQPWAFSMTTSMSL